MERGWPGPSRGVNSARATDRVRALTVAMSRNPLNDGSATEAHAFATCLRAGFEEALRAQVRRLPSHVELVEYATRGGHRTRPVGCLLACAAVGGDWRIALDAAVAVELVHKSSVIRDDIVDGDEMRSGQPALHIAYGVAKAIAVSDLLWTLGLRQISACGETSVAYDCLRAFAETLHDMAAGQLEDVSPSPSSRSVEQRLLVEARKTGALSELAGGLGARMGEGTPAEIDALAQYGRKLGTAFQVLNDVRNLRGAETARSAGSDVRKRRDTVLIAHARETAALDTRVLLEEVRLGSGDLTDPEVETVRDAMLSAGAADFGAEMSARLMAEARTQLDSLSPTLAREILESLARDALLAYAF